MNLENEMFGKIKEYFYKFTAPFFPIDVDYVCHVLLEKSEPSLSSKAYGLLLTLIRWSMGFAT